jgi:hypothetical protein
LLDEIRPSLLIEVGGEHSVAVTHSLVSHKYRLYDAERIGPLIDQAAFNTLAIP